MALRKKGGSGEQSQRQLRVGQEIRHILSDLLAREVLLSEKLSVSVTVSEVRVSPDFRYAKVFVMSLGGHDVLQAIQGLNDLTKSFRSELAKRLRTKFIPELQFLVDDIFEKAEKIDQLLKNPKVARDLKPLASDPPLSS